METIHFPNCAEQKKNAYEAFKTLCIKNNNIEMLYSIEEIIGVIGAKRYFDIWQNNNKGRIPEEPMELIFLCFQYIEDQIID